MTVPGQQRKSQATILMSVMPPKAEVETHWTDVRFVPIADIGGSRNGTTMWHIAMPTEGPSTASSADQRGTRANLRW